MSEAMTTTNHDEIRNWVQTRSGRPSRVNGGRDGGLLGTGDPEESPEEISWRDFSEIFDRRKLAFLDQDETADGEKSRFNKLSTDEENGMVADCPPH